MGDEAVHRIAPDRLIPSGARESGLLHTYIAGTGNSQITGFAFSEHAANDRTRFLIDKDAEVNVFDGQSLNT